MPIDKNAAHTLSYGLFVLTARDGDKDNGCIVNTVQQVSGSPLRISVAVNKENLTHDMIAATGLLNVSVLDVTAPMSLFEHFGFVSGRAADKFADWPAARSENGLAYLTGHVNAFFSGKVVTSVDCGSHTLFVADVTEAGTLAKTESVTYQYYFAHIKPKPAAKKKGWICKICGYIYEGDELPADFICPLCKHGAEDFEPLEPENKKEEEKTMKKYVCDVCGWTYDEAAGDPEHGIAPGTKWEDLPADFECPVCGVGKDSFTAE